MTEREYIMSKLTYFKLFGVSFNWDRISNNLFMWPVAVFALEIARLLLWESITGVGTEMSKTFLGLILVSFIVAVPFNVRSARKIARLREEYRDKASE